LPVDEREADPDQRERLPEADADERDAQNGASYYEYAFR
jgi:hypothetical protein